MSRFALPAHDGHGCDFRFPLTISSKTFPQLTHSKSKSLNIVFFIPSRQFSRLFIGAFDRFYLFLEFNYLI